MSHGRGTSSRTYMIMWLFWSSYIPDQSMLKTVTEDRKGHLQANGEGRPGSGRCRSKDQQTEASMDCWGHQRESEEKNDQDSHQQHCTLVPLQTLDGDELRKDKKDFHVEKNLLCDDSAQIGKAYQLYTLYRDKNGTIQQVTAHIVMCQNIPTPPTAVCYWWPLSLGTSQWMPLQAPAHEAGGSAEGHTAGDEAGHPERPGASQRQAGQNGAQEQTPGQLLHSNRSSLKFTQTNSFRSSESIPKSAFLLKILVSFCKEILGFHCAYFMF